MSTELLVLFITLCAVGELWIIWRLMQKNAELSKRLKDIAKLADPDNYKPKPKPVEKPKPSGLLYKMRDIN